LPGLQVASRHPQADAYTRLQVEQRKQELLRGRRSRLWK
jgi:hypothetical protein